MISKRNGAGKNADVRMLTKERHASEQEDQSTFCSGTKCEGALAASSYKNQKDEDSDIQLKEISLEITPSENLQPLKTSVSSEENKPAFIEGEHILYEDRQLVPSGDNQINQLKKAKSFSCEGNQPAHQKQPSAANDQPAHESTGQHKLKRASSFDKSSTHSLGIEERSTCHHVANTKDESRLAVRPIDKRMQAPVRQARQVTFTRSISSADGTPNSGHELSQTAKPKEVPAEDSNHVDDATVSRAQLVPARDHHIIHRERSIVSTESRQRHIPPDNMECIVQPKKMPSPLHDTTVHRTLANSAKLHSGQNMIQTPNPEPSTATETALDSIARQSEEKMAPSYTDYDAIAKETLLLVLRRACCVSFSASLYGDDDDGDDAYTQSCPCESLDENEQQTEPSFPKTLEEFGYYFNEVGELRAIDNNERFKFVVKENDPEYNERRYNALEKVIVDNLNHLLKEYANLDKVPVPIGKNTGEQKGFFFMSPGALEKETLLLLVNGCGLLRAGKWNSRLIATDISSNNSQLPYIDFAQRQGYGVILMNINLRRTGRNSKLRKSQMHGLESSDDHVLYIWDHFIENSKVKHIAVVEHTFDGIVTSRLSHEREVFRDRVFAIAFIDIVHCGYRLSKQTKHLFDKLAINWVRSNKTLDTELQVNGVLKCRSAGHPLHEWTPSSVKESVFTYILEKHQNTLDCPQVVNRPKLCSCM